MLRQCNVQVYHCSCDCELSGLHVISSWWVARFVLVVLMRILLFWQGAKLAKYMRFPKLCDALFVVFTLVWIATRLIMFPVRYALQLPLV